MAVRYAIQFTPTPHFVASAQAVLYRGAGLDIGALAILLATFTGSMAQYGLLIIPVVVVCRIELRALRG